MARNILLLYFPPLTLKHQYLHWFAIWLYARSSRRQQRAQEVGSNTKVCSNTKLRSLKSRLLLGAALLLILTSKNVLAEKKEEQSNPVNTILNNVEAYSLECVRYAGQIKQRFFSDPNEQIKALSRPYLHVSFSWENDTFTAFWNSDEKYTNGMNLKWINNPCREANTIYTTGIRKMISFFDDPDQFLVFAGGSFGIYMFTPEDITIEERQTDDRPFAGYLYIGKTASVFRRTSGGGSVGISRDIKHTIETQIGVVGPAAGQRWAQNYIHEDVTGGKDSFLAWKNQIDDTFSLNINYLKQSYLKFRTSKFRSFYHVGTNIGSVTNFVNGGISAVFLANQNVFPSLALEPTADLGEPDRFYIYLGIDARYFLSNLYIEGKDESAHDIDLERFVYDVFAGFNWRPKFSFWNNVRGHELNYRVYHRSKEYSSSNPELGNSHVVGSITYTRRF